MSGRCPKCGSTEVWEDNFWSGCDKCNWKASCEQHIVIVPCDNYTPPADDDYDD